MAASDGLFHGALELTVLGADACFQPYKVLANPEQNWARCHYTSSNAVESNLLALADV